MLINNFISSFTGIVDSDITEVLIPEKCLSFNLRILRASGFADIVEIITTDLSLNIKRGDSVRVVGFLYTYQNYLSKYPKLCVCIYSTAILQTTFTTNKNVVICQGTVVKQPKLRKTPTGVVLCDVLLAVNNDLTRISASYIPAICWNNFAEQMSYVHVGTPIYAVGKLQSREYTKELDGKAQNFITREFSINTFKILEAQNDR